jgi:Flp pilus assembly protein TadG
MKMLRFLRRDQRGVTAVEFAMICPIFFGMLIGITQLGILYFARADLRSAVAAGARQAQIFPRPTEAAINTTVQNKIVRLKRANLSGPTTTIVNVPNGYDYAEIEASYKVPIDFIIYRTPPITLTERRRVYISPS